MEIETVLVTTFSAPLWKRYARECVASWATHLPDSVAVWAYDEDGCMQKEGVWRATWQSLDPARSAAYCTFMQHHLQQDIPTWRQDARRFAHKVFALADAAQMTDAPYLVWLDADVFCFADIPDAFFPSLFAHHDLFYLGRPAYSHSECGCWGVDMQKVPSFPLRFADLYSHGAVFRMREQHDSFVFDQLRSQYERAGRMHSHNISRAPSGHAWLASPLARYFDHWKGDRWKTRKSWKQDESLLTARGIKLDLSHPYWRHLPNRWEAR